MKLKISLIIFQFTLLICTKRLFSQNNYQNWTSFTYYYGFVIPHHPYLHRLVRHHAQTFEFQWGYHTSGKKYWHHRFRFPLYSFSILYTYLGPNQDLGNAITLSPNMYLPLQKNNRLNHYMRLSYGIGYISKRFDRIENFKNLAIGSHLNVFVQLSYLIQINVSKNQKLLTGIGFYHYSNGSFKTPNLGINLPNIKIEYQFHFKKRNDSYSSPLNLHEKDSTFHYEVYAGFFLKETYPLFGPKYGVITAGLHIIQPVSFKSSFGIGLDCMYDLSNIAFVEKKKGQKATFTDILRSGFAGDYILSAGPWQFFFSTGLYWHNQYFKNQFLYTRTGLGYKPSSCWILRFLVKSHFFVADYFELSLVKILK